MQVKDCVFCKIIRGEIPSEKEYEDDFVYAFKDINPVAPIHILIVPKKHITGIQSLEKEDTSLVGYMFYVARIIGEKKGVAPCKDMEGGYRLVFNVGRDAGQTVFHLHLHFIAGRSMKWPPG